ncbi:MAG: FHA domain-containing protein [Deltaproteobacteria bacterium]|nr:FHA domain-containing protein [Deltaproteobacteria bacterium]
MQRVYIEYLGDRIELPFGETVVGRDVGCALRFNDPAVSRRHLRFIRRQDHLFLEDLGSANGTLLNGRAVAAPIRLCDGDRVRAGSREVVVRVADVQRVAEPATPTLTQIPRSLAVHRTVGRVATTQMVTVPPPFTTNQRCTRCNATVNDDDEECGACKHRWGSSDTEVEASRINRRRHDRRSAELRLVYVSSELEVEAITRDLSESGVFVYTQVLDPVGTVCHLTILVDGGPPLEARGVVRRVVEHGTKMVGLGVEFTDLGELERGWLRAVIERNQLDAPEA